MKAKLVTAMSVALGIVVLCWMAGMKRRHAAALSLVSYLLMAPTFRNPQTDSFTVDLNAPLSAWQMVSSYYSAADCELAERDLVDTARLYPNIIAFYTLCVPSDDPRLMER